MIIIGAITAWLAIGALAARVERKRWNRGVCRESGLPWVCFDRDSQGGRMYKDGAGHYCDISYPVDNKGISEQR